MSLATFNIILLVALVAVGALALSKKRAASAVFAGFAVGLYFVGSPGAFAVLGSILLLLLLSTPLFVTLGLLTLLCFYFLTSEYQSFHDYNLITEKIFGLTDKNVLLAIPFFVVAGSIMCAGGIARRIVEFADALVGWLPGGLAAAAVLACMFFAAISGSSPVTVIAIGSIMYPALVKKGYSENFSMGLVTTAGSLGILIPPSVPMIIYAIVVAGSMSVNVGDLFIAGIVPGLLIGGLLVGYSIIAGIRRPDFSFKTMQAPSLALIGRRFVDGFWALMLPVVILGGIYPLFGPAGLFTPTEAAAVAVVYAVIVELFVHREITIKKLPPIFFESAVLMGSLLGILIMSFGLNHFLVDQQVPDAAVEWLTSLELTKISFLLLLNVFLLLIGCLMDIISAILIVAPLVAPIAASFGINPLHLGIIFIVNLEIGYLTPPIGLNLFVSSTLFGKPIGQVIRAVLPFMGVMLFGLALVTWFEPISAGLPRVTRGQSFMGAPEIVDMPDAADKPVVPTSSTSTVPRVKSIMELMQEQKRGGAEPEPTEPKRVKSIQELMNEQRQAKTATTP